MLVLSLATIGEEDAPRVGPKAAGLARLLRAGMPVPAGFCIVGRAYREHLQAAGRLDRIRLALAELPAGAPADASAALERIRDCIRTGPMPAGLREQVERHWHDLGARSVAVRSSATAEDLPGQSFAGQYDSYLGVADLTACLGRIGDCWASLWSDRAFEYRRRNGIHHLSVDMAVIVQELVPAEAAGVMFTADPITGRRDCAVIEASFGLGQAVVAGRVAPDRVIVSQRIFRVEDRATASKALEVVAVPAGEAVERAVEPARAGRPCLDDATAERLALLGADIESLLGGPQDIEWAVAGGRLHVLQSRPITALPPAPRRTLEERQIWTNVNLVEVAPDVMTPVTWSGIEELAGPLAEPVLRQLGIEVDLHKLTGLVAGRVYLNLNGLAAVREALPFAGKADARIYFGGRGSGGDGPLEVRIPAEDCPAVRVRWHRRLTRLPGLLWWLLRHPLRHGPGMLRRLQERVTAWRQAPWRSLDDAELARRYRSLDRILKGEMLTDGAAMAMVGVGLGCGLLLMALCRRWLGDEHGEVAKRLLAGLGGMEDAEAGIALWRLATAVRRDGQLEAAVRQEEHFDALAHRLSDTASGRAFLEAWSEFLATHGHHGQGEFEAGNPRWAERPDYVLGLLRSHLAGLGRVDPVARARRLAAERRRLMRDCLSRLRNPIRRMIFEAVVRRAQDGLRFRETLKSRMIRAVALGREMLLELGRRLARRGILEETTDVFFLHQREIIPAASGAFNPRPAVAERRAEYERNVALTPPPIVFGRFDPARCVVEVLDERDGVLRGMGACPGVASGPARVILRAGQDHVMPGEVLVAPATDPAWTPYFLNAAAIVMDVGGQLSHGSILAREYGIPCVVNVGSASRLLRTGQRVEVDGNRGLVRVLP